MLLCLSSGPFHALLVGCGWLLADGGSDSEHVLVESSDALALPPSLVVSQLHTWEGAQGPGKVAGDAVVVTWGHGKA